MTNQTTTGKCTCQICFPKPPEPSQEIVIRHVTRAIVKRAMERSSKGFYVETIQAQKKAAVLKA